MNTPKLLAAAALFVTTALMAQSVHFSGGLVKDPDPTPNTYPGVAGTYDFMFDTTTGAITGNGTGRTLSARGPVASTVNPYTIDQVAIYQGGTQVLLGTLGAPTLYTLAASPGKKRIQADYTFTLSGTLQGNTTYHFEFLQGGSKIGSSAPFTTPAVVPEPETYAAAAALGLVGFGLWRRRNA